MYCYIVTPQLNIDGIDEDTPFKEYDRAKHELLVEKCEGRQILRTVDKSFRIHFLMSIKDKEYWSPLLKIENIKDLDYVPPIFKPYHDNPDMYNINYD